MNNRLLALLCTFTMIVSLCSGTLSGKKIQASEKIPGVELVGATILKTSTKNGTQSLRFLLRVTNYDKITTQDFGIKLNLKDKAPTTISYQNDAREIYAIDTDTKTLEYAVEITGIRAAHVATDIYAQGFIEAPTPGEPDITTDFLERNVEGVAASAGYIITVRSGQIITTEKAQGNKIDISSGVTTIGGKATYNKSLGMLSSDGEIEGVIIPLGQALKTGNTYHITVYGKSDKSMRAWLTSENAQDPKCSDIFEHLEMNHTFDLEVKTAPANHLVLKAPFGQSFSSLIIDKIVIDKLFQVEKKTIDFANSEDISIATEADIPEKHESYENGYLLKANAISGVICTFSEKCDAIVLKYTCANSSDINAYMAAATGDFSPEIKFINDGKEHTLYANAHSLKEIKRLKLFSFGNNSSLTIKSLTCYNYVEPNVDSTTLTALDLSSAVYSNHDGNDFGGFANVDNITLNSKNQRILFNLPSASNGNGNYFIKDEEYVVYVRGNYTGTKGFSVATTAGFEIKSTGTRLTFPANHEPGAFEHVFYGTATSSCGGLAIMTTDGQDGVDGLSISEIRVGPLYPSKDGIEDENGIVMVPSRNFRAKMAGRQYGTFTRDEYYSAYTDSKRPFNVILPPGYTTAKKYPVIYMLHGIFCNQDSFGASADDCPIVQIAGNLYAENQGKEAIIVIPSIRVCADSSIKDTFAQENYKCYDLFREDLLDYLMPYMEENYSIATGRENTAIAGFSMGGREALYIGTTKSEYFGYVGAFCPTYGIFAYPPNWSGVGEDGLFKNREDFTLPAEYKDNTLMMIVKGSDDTTVHEMPTVYHEALENNGVPHFYYVVDGGKHDDVSWGHGLYNYMRKTFQ